MAGGFQVSFVATDRCGTVAKLVGVGTAGSPAGIGPTPTPSPTATPTGTPAILGFAKQFGVSLAGAEFNDAAIPGRQNVDYVYPTDRASYQYYSARGQTLIRIPFLWERVQPTPLGALATNELAGLVATLDAAAASNQRVILDLHNYGRYRGQPLGRADAARFADVWVRIAHAVKGHPGLFGYEIMNESHDLPEGSAAWADLCQSVTDAIRREDAATWILIPGYSWQSAHTWPDQNASLNVSDPTGRLLYSAHTYFDQNNSGTYQNGFDASSLNVGPDRLRPFATWLGQRNARGIITELGVPDNDARWIDVLGRFVAALEAEPRVVGGTYWAGGPWWGNYPLSIEPGNGRDRPQMGVMAAHPSHN